VLASCGGENAEAPVASLPPVAAATTPPSAKATATAAPPAVTAATAPDAPKTATGLAALDPEVAPPTEPLSGFAAVWADATFYVDPSAEAPHFALATFESAPRRERLGYTVPVKIRGVVGDFVEVTTPPEEKLPPPYIPGPDPHCGWLHVNGPRDVSEPSVFVRRSDLAPVLAAPYEASFEDGTSIKLLPGTPVLRTREGTVAASWTVSVPVKGAPALRYSYGSVPPPAKAGGDLTHVLERLDGFTLGGEPFSIGRPFFPPVASAVAPDKRTPDRVLFPIGSRCASLQVSVPKSALAPYRAPHLGGSVGGLAFGTGGSGADYWVLPVGTPLRTKAGRVAGRVGRETVVDEKVEAPCVDLHFSASSSFIDVPKLTKSDGHFQACAAAGARVKRRGLGAGLGGLGGLGGKSSGRGGTKPPAPTP
jgi:hypothetical protein